MNNNISPDVIGELRKCALSFEYFCKTYVKITHPTKGLLPFELTEPQRRVVKHLETNRYTLLKKYRQGGFSTLCLVYGVWLSLFTLDKRVAVVSRCGSCGNNMLYDTVELILNHLPEWLRGELNRKVHRKIEFVNNNSTFYFWPAEACQAVNVDFLIFDEPAFISDMDHVWKCFYPCLLESGHCVAVSTPNGVGNWFYDTWDKAEKGQNDFTILPLDYKEDPAYQDPAFVEMCRKNLGERGFLQEIEACFLAEEPSVTVEAEVDLNKFAEEIKDKYKEPVEDDDDEVLHKSAGKCWNKTGQSTFKFDATKVGKSSRTINARYESSPEDFKCYDVHQKPVILCEQKSDDPFVKGEIPVLDRSNSKEFDVDKEWGELKEDLSILSGIEKPKLDDEDVSDEEILAEWYTGEAISKMWDNIAKVMPQYKDEADRLVKKYKKRKSFKSFGGTDLPTDVLKLAGVESTPDEKTEVEPKDKLLDLVVKGFHENMEIDFDEDFLCINEVPTKITSESVEMAFNGLVELCGEEVALATVVKILKDKLSLLY